jgi:hypothetical protein
MFSWLIILFALWTYPVIGFFIFRLTKNKLDIRKKIVYTIGLFSILALLGIFSNTSTTLLEINWVIITTPYLFVCSLLWWTQFQQRQIIKIFGIIAMFIVFGGGYLSGSIGALGVGFVTAEHDCDYEKWFDNGLIYKEYSLGNAISDYRGKRIDINRTIKYLPIIEWRLESESFFNLAVYGQPLNVIYNGQQKEFILSAERQWSDSIFHWNDTIRIK